MKKCCCLILALCLVIGASTALAWSPQRTYTAREELPAAVMADLPQNLTLAQGYQNERYVWLLMTDGRQYYPYFYRQNIYTQSVSEVYDLVFPASPLPAWQGMAPVLTMDSPSTVTLHFSDQYTFSFHDENRYPFTLCQVTIGDQTAMVGENTLIIEDQNTGSRTRLYGDWEPKLGLMFLDASKLPKTMDELTAMLDQTDWAIVNNPVPTDRLNLRKTASRKGEPIGRYYNGTPVKIISKQGKWSKVEICGAQGYVMNQYITTDQSSVLDAFPARTLLAAAREQSAGVYESFSTDPVALTRASLLDEWYALDTPIVIGDVGDHWVAVMTYSGHGGYMESKWFTPPDGN